MAQKVLPRRLKKLDSSDLMSLENDNGDIIVLTKIETSNIIREFIKSEFSNLNDDIFFEEKKRVENLLTEKIEKLEKEIDSYIQYRFDCLAEKVCEYLISRKFNEEIENRVDKKINDIKIKKSGRGFI
jgi:hypothetical protein